MDGFRTPASEFPNDNPELHDGAVWVCLQVCGPLRAIRRPPRSVAPEPPMAEPSVPAPVLRLAPVAEPEVAPEAEDPALEPAGPDPFEELVEVMVQVALAAGATRAAAVLPALLAGERVEIETLRPDVVAAFVEVGATWRRALCGEEADLSACETTLDAWCAELIASISGTPARAAELRRELRAQGVAAFGLLRAA